MSDWTPRLLRALAAHREVIIYDSAGIGQSTIEAGWSIGPADYFKFQADTLAGLITALQLDVAPDVLGWCAQIAHTQLIPTDHTRSHHRVLKIPRRTCWQASSRLQLDAAPDVLGGCCAPHASMPGVAGMRGEVHDYTSSHPTSDVKTRLQPCPLVRRPRQCPLAKCCCVPEHPGSAGHWVRRLRCTWVYTTAVPLVDW